MRIKFHICRRNVSRTEVRYLLPLSYVMCGCRTALWIVILCPARWASHSLIPVLLCSRHDPKLNNKTMSHTQRGREARIISFGSSPSQSTTPNNWEIIPSPPYSNFYYNGDASLVGRWGWSTPREVVKKATHPKWVHWTDTQQRNQIPPPSSPHFISYTSHSSIRSLGVRPSVIHPVA